MKIIKKDNYDRDTVSDVLIAENVHPFYADTMVTALNIHFSGAVSQDYFQVVLDNYKLHIYEP